MARPGHRSPARRAPGSVATPTTSSPDMRSIFTSTRYANVTATLALVLALGGTSYAVSQVTGANVKNGSLTGKDIKKESLGSKQIKGLTAGDSSGALPTGPAGADSRKSLSSVAFGSAATASIFCHPGADFVVFTANSSTESSQDLPFYV